MERKDWLYLGLLLTIILLFAVVICNQIALEKSVDEKIQQVTDRVNETAMMLDYTSRVSIFPIMATIDNIASVIGAYSMSNPEGIESWAEYCNMYPDIWGVKMP